MPLIMNSYGEFVDDYEPYRPMRLSTKPVARGAGRYEKTCPQCFARFRTDSPAKVYCSGSCTEAARREREQSERNRDNCSRRVAKGVRLVCERCGKAYVGRSRSRKYCSDGCKKAAEGERRRERGR